MRKKKLFKILVHQFLEKLYTAEKPEREFPAWLSAVRKDRPLVMELGMGTGDFLNAMAEKNPEQFFLGIEIKPDRITKACQKSEQKKLSNIAFLQAKIEKLSRYRIPKAEQLYILFPDPWPKKRHIDRRLTSLSHLKSYMDWLSPHAEVIFKTDDKALFDYTKENVQAVGWTFTERNAGIITHTAYEKRFVISGKRIYTLAATVS